MSEIQARRPTLEHILPEFKVVVKLRHMKKSVVGNFRGKFQGKFFGKLGGGFWVLSLAIALCFYGAVVFQKSALVSEYPEGCDAFGYLFMAKNFRQARISLLEDNQTRELVSLMQAQKLPVAAWSELVAPHSFHYFPQSGNVGPQYPPGTGWVLSFFPEGKAVKTLNQIGSVILLSLGLVALTFAALRGAWISSGFVGVVTYWVLEVLHQIGGGSFSINVILLPLTLSILLIFLAKNSKAAVSKTALFFAGCFFGLAILSRIPVVFLYPGIFYLALGSNGSHRSSTPRIQGILKVAFSPFNWGVVLFCIPLLIHQSQVSGAWYLSTYSSGDNTFPELGVLRSNLSFYLGHGYGSGDNWLIFDLILGMIGFVYWRGLRSQRVEMTEVKRLAAAASVTWGVPMLYFLTHRVQIGYYPVPATLATALLMSIGVLLIESRSAGDPKCKSVLSNLKRYSIRYRLLACLAWIPGLIAFQHVWSMRHEIRDWQSETSAAQTKVLKLPEELRNSKAWIWADRLTGTIRYYENKPAFKLAFSSPETRLFIYQNLFHRGEPQYIVHDSPTMQSIMDEVRGLGGILVKCGMVEQVPAYRIDWPARF